MSITQRELKELLQEYYQAGLTQKEIAKELNLSMINQPKNDKPFNQAAVSKWTRHLKIKIKKGPRKKPEPKPFNGECGEDLDPSDLEPGDIIIVKNMMPVQGDDHQRSVQSSAPISNELFMTGLLVINMVITLSLMAIVIDKIFIIK